MCHFGQESELWNGTRLGKVASLLIPEQGCDSCTQVLVMNTSEFFGSDPPSTWFRVVLKRGPKREIHDDMHFTGLKMIF